MNSDNGIVRTPNLLLLDIDRPLPFGTRITYTTPGSNEVKIGVVVEGGYYSIIIWDGSQVHIGVTIFFRGKHTLTRVQRKEGFIALRFAWTLPPVIAAPVVLLPPC